MIWESGTGIAPGMWPSANSFSTSILLSTINISAWLFIFCNSSSVVIRGTRSEGDMAGVESGVVGVGVESTVAGGVLGTQLTMANSISQAVIIQIHLVLITFISAYRVIVPLHRLKSPLTAVRALALTPV
jgi:hypothetical protein